MTELNLDEITKNAKVITMDEWVRENIISDFKTVTNDDIKALIETKFPLKSLEEQDLSFTYEIEDDGVNTTLRLSDYDWMHYSYDTRFPTQTIGTLSIRFEYDGFTTCFMYVRQYLPKDISGLDENYVLCHEYTFSSDVFDKYLVKDLESRIDNIQNSTLAYTNDKIMLEWYNQVLAEGTKNECVQKIDCPFEWESVRRPKQKAETHRIQISI